MKTALQPKSGSALIGVLWCVALLALLVVGILHTARIDLIVAKNYADRIQARYLALAGIEKAKALLLQDARNRSRSARSHSGALNDAPAEFKDIPLGRGVFRVLRPGESEEPVYGVSDEDGLLNINKASLEELMKIRGMTPDVAAAVVDWRDRDTAVSPGGAETEYYASLRPPYLPRNQDYPTIRELLMVRGVTRPLLFGGAGGGGGRDRGWSALLTARSGGANQSATGKRRVSIQTADEAELTGVRGITPEIAKAIIAHRGRSRLENLADLLEVTRGDPNNALRNRLPGSQGGAGNPGGGPRVIDERLFKDIADELTVSEDTEIPGLVNINTAPLEVLVCLPGMNRPIAEAIVARRNSNGYFANIAELLDVAGVTRDIFKTVNPRLTVRSETYRILAEGQVGENGARARVEMMVRVTPSDISTLGWREDDL